MLRRRASLIGRPVSSDPLRSVLRVVLDDQSDHSAAAARRRSAEAVRRLSRSVTAARTNSSSVSPPAAAARRTWSITSARQQQGDLLARHQVAPGSVTKSMSCSTARTNGVSRSSQVATTFSSLRQKIPGSATPRAAQTPSFQGMPRGIWGQARDAHRGGPDGLPHVDVGGAGDEHVGVADLGRQPGLLAAGDEVVDQHAEPPAGPGRELGHDVGQVVDAVEPLDDDPFDPQVVAPDLLHQLGVVDAFDQDPARLGHPGPGARPRPGCRRRCGRWPTPGRRPGGRCRPPAVAAATRWTACPPTEKEPGAFRNRFSRPVWPATTTSSPSRATSRPAKPDERWATGRPGVGFAGREARRQALGPVDGAAQDAAAAGMGSDGHGRLTIPAGVVSIADGRRPAFRGDVGVRLQGVDRPLLPARARRAPPCSGYYAGAVQQRRGQLHVPAVADRLDDGGVVGGHRRRVRLRPQGEPGHHPLRPAEEHRRAAGPVPGGGGSRSGPGSGRCCSSARRT